MIVSKKGFECVREGGRSDCIYYNNILFKVDCLFCLVTFHTCLTENDGSVEKWWGREGFSWEFCQHCIDLVMYFSFFLC